MRIDNIRQYFYDELQAERFTIDKTGAKTIEMIGASFIADESAIFGIPNQEYIDAEIEWYNSMSTNVGNLGSIYGKVPAAWAYTANAYGEINSNYGTLIYSPEYCEQYDSALAQIIADTDTRRSQMVYNRPSIQLEYNSNGKNDFICTNAVHYYVRDEEMHACVQMRSNDVIFGFRNDYAWQKHVLDKFTSDYNEYSDNSLIAPGNIHWQVSNLHVYERHFDLVKEHYNA